MDVNISRIIFVLIFPYIVFFSSFYLERINKPAWFIRKYIHTSGMFMVGLFGSILATLEEVYIVLGVLLITVILLSIHPKIQLLQNLFRMGTRENEKQSESLLTTVLTITVALLLLYFTFERRWIFMVSMLAVGFGDGFGEFIGKPYGKHKYNILAPKSLEGSLGVFFGTLFGALFTALIFELLSLSILWPFIVISFAAMIVEGLSFSLLDVV